MLYKFSTKGISTKGILITTHSCTQPLLL